MADKRPCRVCNFTRQKSYGVVVPSLYDLKTKGEYFIYYDSHIVQYKSVQFVKIIDQVFEVKDLGLTVLRVNSC